MKIKENILFIFFIILILVVTYFWYTTWRVPLTSEDSFTQADIFGVDFLTMATRMKRIQLKSDFLQSEAFLSLEDLTPLIQLPATTGRRNPFLPISVETELILESVPSE